MRWTALTLSLAFLAATSPASAQTPTPGFLLIGHVERFTLVTTAGATPAAKMTVRGQDVTLPAGLLVTMPGGYLTPKQLFRGQPRSGLALADNPPVPFEAEIIGNIVQGKFIAGVVRLSQGALHSGAGFIQEIRPNGELRVGVLGGPPGARVRLNDPTGVYGPKNADRPDVPLDDRFALDPDNSPVHAKTGFPVCIPRGAATAFCKESNRPTDANWKRFTCGAIPNSGIFAHTVCDPDEPVPLRVGDYVTYVGMLQKAPDGSFVVAAHGLDAEIGVYTSPGSDPAYVFIEEARQGTLGEKFPAPIASEETTRFRIVGFSTDPTRPVRIEIVDGRIAGERSFSFTGGGGLPPSNGPVLGRFRNTWPSKDDSRAVRRDVRATIDGATVSQAPNRPIAGQYVAPITEYIYPEATDFGRPGYALPVPFENFCFLAVGGGRVATPNGDVVTSRLDPFPSSGHDLSQPIGTSTSRTCDSD